MFVTLLIVCSLLLTGGVVVFVNQTDDFQTKVKNSEADKKRAEDERDSANRLLSVAQDQAHKAAATVEEMTKKHQTELDAAEAEKAKLQASVKNLTKDNTVLAATNTDLASSLNNTTKNIGDLQGRLKTLTDEADTLRSRMTEVNGVNTDLRKQLDAIERERRNLTEQLVQKNSDLERALKVIQTTGLNPTAPLLRPADDLQGVVRGVKSQDGVNYATISLGSTSRVEKGMQFAVYNPSANKYLAILTIQTVEATESFGRLEGKDAALVGAGNVVIPNPAPTANR